MSSDPTYATAMRERASLALDALGIPATDTNVQQMIVMAASLEIFEQRNLTYGDAWQEAGIADKVHHLRNKLKRIEGVSGVLTGILFNEMNDTERGVIQASVIDSAQDMINYAGFLIRQVKALNGKHEGGRYD